MKKLFLLVFCTIGIFVASAQNFNYNDTNVVTGYFKISLSVHSLDSEALSQNPVGQCNLQGDGTGIDTVYIHSGAGDSTSSAWDNIVGHWGLTDSVGEMNLDSIGGFIDSLGNQGIGNYYSICFNLFDYYSHATIDTINHGGTGVGGLLAGQTVYNIGLVFRDGNCPYNSTEGRDDCGSGAYTGKDETCNDIYIFNLPVPSAMSVQDDEGNTFPGVTASWVNGCPLQANPLGGFYYDSVGLQGISTVAPNVSIKAFPNPFASRVNIQFLMNSVKGSALEIFDVLGNKVVDFTNSLQAGHNSFIWDGTDQTGATVSAGVYVVRLKSGDNYFVEKLIKQ